MQEWNLAWERTNRHPKETQPHCAVLHRFLTFSPPIHHPLPAILRNPEGEIAVKQVCSMKRVAVPSPMLPQEKAGCRADVAGRHGNQPPCVLHAAGSTA